MMAPADHLTRQNSDGVALLTINHPASRNALSSSMIDAMTAELAAIAKDRSVRAVILAATGSAFCSGHDLKEITRHREDEDYGRAFFEDLLARCAGLMLALTHLPQPVIAAVEGVATAAGCQLVATSDLAIAGAAATFATPGVHIGLFCSTPMVALSRAVGRKHAMEMLLTGASVDADHAMQIGLVNRIVPAGSAVAEAQSMARIITSKSPTTMRVGKQAFYKQAELGLADAYAYASRIMTENMLAQDAEEGISAFLEKRAPEWSEM